MPSAITAPDHVRFLPVGSLLGDCAQRKATYVIWKNWRLQYEAKRLESLNNNSWAEQNKCRDRLEMCGRNNSRHLGDETKTLYIECIFISNGSL